jgi:transposase
MSRSRRTRIAAEEKTRAVLAVLANEMTCAEAARRCGVSGVTMTKWKHQFLAAGAERLQEVPSGPAGAKGTAEQRRLQLENEQLKLALAEATLAVADLAARRCFRRSSPFADLEALREAAGLPVSRFATLAGIPERTYRRHCGRHQH